MWRSEASSPSLHGLHRLRCCQKRWGRCNRTHWLSKARVEGSSTCWHLHWCVHPVAIPSLGSSTLEHSVLSRAVQGLDRQHHNWVGAVCVGHHFDMLYQVRSGSVFTASHIGTSQMHLNLCSAMLGSTSEHTTPCSFRWMNRLSSINRVSTSLLALSCSLSDCCAVGVPPSLTQVSHDLYTPTFPQADRVACCMRGCSSHRSGTTSGFPVKFGH